MVTSCWECEKLMRQPVTVTLVLPTGQSPQVQLCQSCYQAYYLPLAAEMSVEETRQRPPAPMRATPCARRTPL